MTRRQGQDGRVRKSVVETGDLSVSQLEYAPGARLPPHRHELPRLTLLVDGHLAERLERREEVVSAPMAGCTKAAGVLHTTRAGSNGARVLLIEARTAGPWADRTPVVLRSKLIASLGHRLWIEISLGHLACPTTVESLAWNLAAEFDHPEGQDHGNPPLWLVRTRERLLDDPRRAPPMEALAGSAGVHPSHLSRAFRRWFGASPGECLREERLRRAAHRLRGSHDSISRIAHDLGFADHAHLTRLYKRRFGITPSDFRRRGG